MLVFVVVGVLATATTLGIVGLSWLWLSGVTQLPPPPPCVLNADLCGGGEQMIERTPGPADEIFVIVVLGVLTFAVLFMVYALLNEVFIGLRDRRRGP